MAMADLHRTGCFENTLRFFGYVVGFSVSDDNELVRYEGLLVFHYAVLRNANAVQPGTQSTQSADHRGPFQRSDNPTDQRAKDYDGTDARNKIGTKDWNAGLMA
jgi:hypothetical protein